ncbi:MAG: hypothetical protein J5634_04570 [Bacilli bacterium]|nr:hypothetical protein [Bacilli bacterium]
MEKKFNFKTKKVILTAASLVLAITLTGCPELESILSQEINNQTTTSEFSYEPSTTPSKYETTSVTANVSESTSDTIAESSKPTGYIDYLDEVMSYPKINYKMTSNDHIANFTKYNSFEFLGIEFGFDNPVYQRELDTYLNMEDIKMYEVNYLQDYYEETGPTCYYRHKDQKEEYPQYYDCYNFERSIALYILKEMGLRLYIDEIPYSFFEANFSDLIKEAESKSHNEVISDDRNVAVAVYQATSFDNLHDRLKVNNPDDYVRKLVFLSAWRYNHQRAGMVYGFSHFTNPTTGQTENIGIDQGRTADGRNVLLPTEEKYNALMEDLQYQDCYKNVENLFNPITTEDLVNAGINVDEYDHYIKEVAKIDFSMAYTNGVEEQGQSRTRTS